MIWPRFKRYTRRALGVLLLLLTGCGDRDEPLPAPAAIPGRTLAVVALGDSLTEGIADTPGMGGYPRRLEQLLDGLKPGTQVINLGKSGWTSAQLVKRQLPTAVSIMPQIALVWIGSNDLWRYYRAEQEEQDLKNFTANIDTILGTLHETGAHVFIALLDDQSQRPVARTTEIEPYTQADRDRMARRAATYNRAIAAAAEHYGAATVDFYHTTIFTDPSTLAGDGNHPTAHGYDLIAQMWFESIRKNPMPDVFR